METLLTLTAMWSLSPLGYKSTTTDALKARSQGACYDYWILNLSRPHWSAIKDDESNNLYYFDGKMVSTSKSLHFFTRDLYIFT